MVAIKKTEEIIAESNKATNNAKILVVRKKFASQLTVSWDRYDETKWSKYQIKETDMRTKTATFTSPQYIDLTTGQYCVLITSPFHEDFAGIILSIDYDNDTGLYNYQCQDFSREYQGKFELISSKPLHRVLKYLITKGGISIVGSVSKALLKSWKRELSGLRPAYQYEQEYYGGPKNFNPMTMKNRIIVRNKSWIETIKSLIYSSGAYIDVYFSKEGVLKIEPYHKDDFYNTGLYLTTPELAHMTQKFDTTNIITGVQVHSTDKTKIGTTYSSASLINLDLNAIFGNVDASIENPNQQQNTTVKSTNNKKTTAKTKAKAAVNKKKTSNIYGTRTKTVWLSIDNIYGSSADYQKMYDIKKVLQQYGWKVYIAGRGPSTHYDRRAECKKGIWFELYGGFCAGTIRESCENAWFLNPLKKNRSRVVIGFLPPCTNGILKGGSYYSYLGPAHDWEGSQSYARLNYPGKFMSNHGVPWMIAKNGKEMAAKFLAGGDNYATTGNGYKWYGSWTKRNVTWI